MPKMQQRNKLITVSLVTILLTVALDIYTKELVLNMIQLYSKVDIIGGVLSFVNSKNYGAAFSFLNSSPDWFRKPFFIIMPLLAMGLVSYIMIKGKNSVANIFAYSMILGGALGNLISRIIYGFVTDFIDVKLTSSYHWPTFNVADIAITIGVFLVFIDMVKVENARKKQKAKPVKKVKRKKK